MDEEPRQENLPAALPLQLQSLLGGVTRHYELETEPTGAPYSKRGVRDRQVTGNPYRTPVTRCYDGICQLLSRTGFKNLTRETLLANAIACKAAYKLLESERTALRLSERFTELRAAEAVMVQLLKSIKNPGKQRVHKPRSKAVQAALLRRRAKRAQ